MKFSIVTPAFNSARYIRETIDAVVTQAGDFSVEYIVLDNRSTDGTLAIVDEYRERLASGRLPLRCRDLTIDVYSESDDGMYDAINRGFARATGDVYAWINSDDLYLPGAFDVVRRALETYPQIEWIKGITSYINAHSTMFSVGRCNLYRRDFIRAGLYGTVLNFIQQDSVFWSADLWKRSGGANAAMRVAGDYALWRGFAQHAPLFSLNAYVSAFRRCAGQLSADLGAYLREIAAQAPVDPALARRARRWFQRIDDLPYAVRPSFYRMVFGAHAHQLVLLQDGVEPRLHVSDDYYDLKSRL